MKDTYVAALLEDMNGKIDVIAEGVVGLNEKVTLLEERVEVIERDLSEVKLNTCDLQQTRHTVSETA